MTVGNDHLAEFARSVTDRVSILPTVVDVSVYQQKKAGPSAKPLTAGWSGSDRSIEQTLFPFLDMFARLQAMLGFKFLIMSRPKPVLPNSDLNWDFVEWSETAETDLAAVMDIGIMPLVDDEYQRGKCGCKLLQYMAAGLPSVASPVGINRHLIQHGQRASCAEDLSKNLQRLNQLVEPLFHDVLCNDVAVMSLPNAHYCNPADK